MATLASAKTEAKTQFESDGQRQKPQAPVDIDSSFQVPWSVHVLSGLVSACPWFWKAMGNLETMTVADQLPQGVDRPVFISGIARSGSTILLEALASHRDVGTHQYRDFPMLYTPVWWHQANQKQVNDSIPTERTHGDGILVTPESPEAMEETLWMGYFRDAHDPRKSQVLDRGAEVPAFERFYRDHVRKLLHVRQKSRYVSKGNYNLSRMSYLQKMFPEARFVIPIRHPVSHIASLMKQHHLFEKGEQRYPRALKHMQRVGHFEFGLDRRPINVGNNTVTSQILKLWEKGDEVRGWARYWNELHCWVARTLEKDSELRGATKIVRYEDLCDSSALQLSRLLAHCDLNEDSEVTRFAERIHAPTYYKPQFSDEELEIIAEETEAARSEFGYERSLI